MTLAFHMPPPGSRTLLTMRNAQGKRLLLLMKKLRIAVIKRGRGISLKQREYFVLDRIKTCKNCQIPEKKEAAIFQEHIRKNA